MTLTLEGDFGFCHLVAHDTQVVDMVNLLPPENQMTSSILKKSSR